MSGLTSQLLGQRKCRGDARWPSILDEVTNRLVKQYGRPDLGNFRDPVKEIFYILLSARTSEVLYQRAHKRLFERFPTIASLSLAGEKEVLQCIGDAGLGGKRASQIPLTAMKLLTDFGPNPEGGLRALSANAAFRYLTALPGLGPKSALCVMMWSLDFDVFPVDVNVQRILERIGVIRKNAKHYQAQQRLPKYIPAGRSLDLHSAMMVHGREVCSPRLPKCGNCVIVDLCNTGKKTL